MIEKIEPTLHTALERSVRGVVELKILDDEGLGKAERQAKLARLFSTLDPDRPVHVLDRDLLCQKGRRAYDRAMEGPIKGAVRGAKGQLIQSRADFPETKQSILMLVNNGNTSLGHDEIVEMVGRRARNDTNDIDGVVIAGAYLHSDGFETIALWPIDYVPIHLDRAFHEFDALRGAFHAYAERAMTAAIVDGTSDEMTKGPILDISFDADGKTFVKPAQRFWTHGAHAKGEERSDESIAGGAPISRFGKIPIRTRYVFGSRTACL